MNEIKVKVEVEKKLVIPELSKIEGRDEHCIVDDQDYLMHCNDIHCEDCICNIDNLMMLANSQKLQLL